MMRRTYTVDRYTRVMLTILAALLTVIAIELWADRPTSMPAAQAQIPDTGLQRLQIIDETKRTNELLEQILKTLKTYTFKVKVQGADKSSGADK